MKITDLNTEGGIGANSLFVEIGPFRLLIDAGLNPKKLGLAALPNFGRIEDYSLDFIILTHCHLDHLGALPVILRKQPQVKILVSSPTLSLAPRMLLNSYNVMKRQREEHGIKEYPLYSRLDIDFCAQHMFPLHFDRPSYFRAGNEQIAITLHPSGHLPGAAGCQITYKHRKILFTGDVLFKSQRILNGARLPSKGLDTLVMETTRGARQRPDDQSREAETQRLFESVNRTIEQGGSCLIPVFALGRMQEMLTLIYDARKDGRLVDCPIYSSGLGMDLVNHFDRISRKTSLLNFRRRVIRDLGIRKPNWPAIRPGRDLTEKGLYLMSSGMLVEETPSYRIAASLLGHTRNTISFIGYCEEETPGGRLLATPRGTPFTFETLDSTENVNARVEQFDLSSHADREELRDFAIRRNPRAIVLTHGDTEARDWFSEQFSEHMPRAQVTDPTPLKPYWI